MIVVKVELHSAKTKKITKLAEMRIINDGTSGRAMRGNYDAHVLRKPDFMRITREAHIDDWPSVQRTIWHLIGAFLKNMGYVK